MWSRRISVPGVVGSAAFATAAAQRLASGQCDGLDKEEMVEDKNFGMLNEPLARVIKAPGPLDRWHDDVKRLTAIHTYQGMKIEVQKPITPNFALTHRLQMGGSPYGAQGPPQHYQFGCQVFNEKCVAVSQLDIQGTSESQIIIPQQPGSPYGGKVIVVMVAEGKNDMIWGDLDAGGDTWNSQFRVGHNFQGIPGAILGASYTQSITPSFAMGGEAQLFVKDMNTAGTLTGKYDTPKYSGTLTLVQGPPASQDTQPTVLTAGYHRKVTDNRVNVGTELVMNFPTMETQATLGLEFQLKQSKISTSIDTSGKICSHVEAKGAQQGPAFTFSAEVHYGAAVDQQGEAHDSWKVGYGLHIG